METVFNQNPFHYMTCKPGWSLELPLWTPVGWIPCVSHRVPARGHPRLHMHTQTPTYETTASVSDSEGSIDDAFRAQISILAQSNEHTRVAKEVQVNVMLVSLMLRHLLLDRLLGQRAAAWLRIPW